MGTQVFIYYAFHFTAGLSFFHVQWGKRLGELKQQMGNKQERRYMEDQVRDPEEENTAVHGTLQREGKTKQNAGKY